MKVRSGRNLRSSQQRGFGGFFLFPTAEPPKNGGGSEWLTMKKERLAWGNLDESNWKKISVCWVRLLVKRGMWG